MVKIVIYGTPVHPKLKDEIKKLIEAGVRTQNRRKLVDYNEMADDITEGVEKFLERQELQENKL